MPLGDRIRAARRRYRVGQGYGGSRARLGANARIDEWEWVYTGPAFAQAHPLGRFGGALWWVALYLLCHMAALVVLLLAAPSVFPPIMLAIDIAAVIAVINGWQMAYGLVLVPLCLTFPLSAPLLIYWIDGVRPNLTYLHRFERLVPHLKEPDDV